VIEYTDILLIIIKVMGLRGIRLDVLFDHRSVAHANKLISELKGIVVIAQHRKHILGVAIPVAIDSLKGFSGSYSNSSISRHW